MSIRFRLCFYICGEVGHGSPHLVGGPIMGSARCVPAPAIEGVVEQHSGAQLFEVVVDTCARGRGMRQEPGAPRVKGRAAPCRRREQSWPAVQECFGAGGRIPRPSHRRCRVRPGGSMGVFDVEGCGIETVGYGCHFLRRHKKKHGGGIDKAPDEPGAGDAVNLWPCAGHPNCAAFGIALGDILRRNKRQFCCLPFHKATFQRHGISAELAQPCGGSLTQFCPMVADDDDGFSGIARCPIRKRFGGFFSKRRG